MRRKPAPLLLALLVLSCRPSAEAPPPPLDGIRYTLELTPDLELLTYDARALVELPNRTGKPLERVPLEVYAGSTTFAGKAVSIRKVTVNGKEVEAHLEGVKLEVPVDPPVAPGGAVRIDVAYAGVLPRITSSDTSMLAQGMDQLMELLGGSLGKAEGGVGYGILAGSDAMLSFGSWYPQLPAWHDGAWQLGDDTPLGDPGFVEIADYSLTVTVPKEVEVVATGVLKGTKDAGSGKVAMTFDAPDARSVAVQVARELTALEATSGKTTVRSHHLPGGAAHARRALDVAAGALAYYEETFGPYAWTELDVVQAPLAGGAGGVEFTGLVTCSSELYGGFDAELAPLMALAGGLAPSLASTMADVSKGMDEMLDVVVAHEVAHQWWNAAVGSDSRRSPFMDEALANFSAIRYLEHARGAEVAERQRRLQLVLPYQMYRTFGGADMPVTTPVSRFPDTIAYAAIVYGKGALFFEALVERFGEKPVLDALARHYAKGKLGIVSAEDLRRELRGIAPGQEEEIDRLWDRWLVETHGDEDIGTADEMLGPLAGILKGGGGLDLERLLGTGLQELLKGFLGEAGN